MTLRHHVDQGCSALKHDGVPVEGVQADTKSRRGLAHLS